MELLIETISKIWEEIENYNVPILDIPFTSFFIGLLLCTVIIRTISIILGGSDHGGNDKND